MCVPCLLSALGAGFPLQHPVFFITRKQLSEKGKNGALGIIHDLPSDILGALGDSLSDRARLFVSKVTAAASLVMPQMPNEKGGRLGHEGGRHMLA